MTATEHNSRDGDALRVQSPIDDAIAWHIELTCRTAIDGRRAARALAQWTQSFELGEAEFQLLWCLRAELGDGRDQTTLARELAISPAQVSAAVERMRAKGWICQQVAVGDRRRHLWQLSTAGQSLLDEMLARAAELRYEPADVHRSAGHGCLGREAAA